MSLWACLTRLTCVRLLITIVKCLGTVLKHDFLCTLLDKIITMVIFPKGTIVFCPVSNTIILECAIFCVREALLETASCQTITSLLTNQASLWKTDFAAHYFSQQSFLQYIICPHFLWCIWSRFCLYFIISCGSCAHVIVVLWALVMCGSRHRQAHDEFHCTANQITDFQEFCHDQTTLPWTICYLCTWLPPFLLVTVVWLYYLLVYRLGALILANATRRPPWAKLLQCSGKCGSTSGSSFYSLCSVAPTPYSIKANFVLVSFNKTSPFPW